MRLLLVQPRLRAALDADNLGTVRLLVRASEPTLSADDVLLLPEHVVPAGAIGYLFHHARFT